MKLIRLKLLSSFRSLTENFELYFREENNLKNDRLKQFHPYCFAGLNGSGKSNVLEVLSLIFFYLECKFSKFLPEEFNKVFEANPLPFYFELEYLYFESEEKCCHIYIRYSRNGLEFYRDNEKLKKGIEPKREGGFKEDALAKQYLPQIIVGYSSGENEILSLPFIKSRLMHYDYYQQTLLNDEEYQNRSLTSLVYIDYSMNQAILLANFLMQHSEVLAPIQDILQIEKLHSFRLYIKDFEISNEELSNAEKKAKKLFSQIKGTDSIIEKLTKCATCSYQTDEGTLILDYYVNKVTKEAFKFHFESPYELFRSFQTLAELNTHSVSKKIKDQIYKNDGMYLSEKMPKPEAEQLAFYFNNFLITKKNIAKPLLVKSLSDGEHQFLHSMGICLMLSGKSALLLLDEPETHFNPEWRSKFISMLNESLERGGSNNLTRDILITSHSPFIISDCFPDKVIVFEKGKSPANAKQMKFNTFGTSVNIVLEEIFKKEASIPDYSLFMLNRIKNRVFTSLDDIEQAKEDSRLLGQSPEKVFLFRELLIKEKELQKEESKNVKNL